MPFPRKSDVGRFVSVGLDLAGSPLGGTAGVLCPGVDDPFVGVGSVAGRAFEVLTKEDGLITGTCNGWEAGEGELWKDSQKGSEKGCCW